MIMNPKISVIILTYNRAQLLRETIQSVLDQTYSDFELLVIDDGSTDQTKEVIASFDSNSIRYINKSHTGIPDSRNFGVKNARGNYIVWLDSDDLIEPQTLELLVKATEDDPGLDIVFTDHYLMNSNGEIQHRFHYHDSPDGKALIAAAVYWTPILQCGTMIRKKVYAEVGSYDTSFKKTEDHEFWIRILKGYKFKHIALPLYKRRIHTGRITYAEWGNEYYKAEVLRRMLKKFQLEEMFPKIKWHELDQARAEALAFLEVGKIFMDRGAYNDSYKYLVKSIKCTPSLVAAKQLVRLAWRSCYQRLVK